MPNKSLLDSIKIQSPCSESWDEMQGSDTVRFCSHCAKNIHDLSTMTRREAQKIVADSNGNLCVRYIRRPDGQIQTTERKFHQIANRTSRIAAGVFGAAITLSNAAYAQGDVVRVQTDESKNEKPAKPEAKSSKAQKDDQSAISQISFTIVDQMDAVIPSSKVTLTNQQSKQSLTSETDEYGVVHFINLEHGLYDLEVEGPPGFAKLRGRSFQIENAIEPNIKLTLEVAVTMGVIVVSDYEYPLLQAIAQSDVKEVKRLIQSGAKLDVEDANFSNRTALHVAVETGNVEIARMLLDAGAKINALTTAKETALLMIDKDATPELVRLLIERGANVNAQNEEGETALMKAADDENLEIVRFLLDGGANPNLKNSDGETALDKTSDDEIKKLLKSYGAR